MNVHEQFMIFSPGILVIVLYGVITGDFDDRRFGPGRCIEHKQTLYHRLPVYKAGRT